MLVRIEGEGIIIANIPIPIRIHLRHQGRIIRNDRREDGLHLAAVLNLWRQILRALTTLQRRLRRRHILRHRAALHRSLRQRLTTARRQSIVRKTRHHLPSVRPRTKRNLRNGFRFLFVLRIHLKPHRHRVRNHVRHRILHRLTLQRIRRGLRATACHTLFRQRRHGLNHRVHKTRIVLPRLTLRRRKRLRYPLRRRPQGRLRVRVILSHSPRCLKLLHQLLRRIPLLRQLPHQLHLELRLLQKLRPRRALRLHKVRKPRARLARRLRHRVQHRVRDRRRCRRPLRRRRKAWVFRERFKIHGPAKETRHNGLTRGLEVRTLHLAQGRRVGIIHQGT